MYNLRWEPGDAWLVSIVQDLINSPPLTYLAIVARDFNLHYLLWDQYDRYDRKAKALLDLALRWDLELHTLKGATTKAL